MQITMTREELWSAAKAAELAKDQLQEPATFARLSTKFLGAYIEAQREPGDVADDAGGDPELSEARTAAFA